MFSFAVSKNHRGMSLIEVLVALGLFSMVGILSASLMTDGLKSRVQSESKKNIISAVNDMASDLRRQKDAGANCKTILNLPSGFKATGEMPLEMIVNSNAYKSGSEIADLPAFRIEKLYMADTELIRSSGGAQNYVANIYIEPAIKRGNEWMPLPRRNISSVSMKISGSNLADCSILTRTADPATSCQLIGGMQWNASTQRCENQIARTPDSGDFTECPGGTQKNSQGACVPTSSGCRPDLLSSGFNNGIVTSCVPVPAGYTIAYVVTKDAAVKISQGEVPGEVLSSTTTLPSPPPVPPTLPPSGPSPGSPGTSGGGGASPPLPPPDAPPVETSCYCGLGKVGKGAFCLSCYKDDPLGWFSSAKYYYTIYRCGENGLEYVTQMSTKKDPAVCVKPNRPGNCNSNFSNCEQGMIP